MSTLNLATLTDEQRITNAIVRWAPCTVSLVLQRSRVPAQAAHPILRKMEKKGSIKLERVRRGYYVHLT